MVETTTTTTTTECLLCRDDADIKTAVEAWATNSVEAEKKFGPITDWDTSKVTDMSELFCVNPARSSGDPSYSCVWNVYSSFNEDISKWNTASVTDMTAMFYYADVFNQDIGEWDTSRVTNMAVMFYNPGVFNQDIGEWTTDAVTDMNGLTGVLYSSDD